MNDEEKFHEEQIGIFRIVASAWPEDTLIEDSFDNSIDNISEIYRKIKCGDLMWFGVTVKCYIDLGEWKVSNNMYMSFNGMEMAYDSLGGNLYSSYEEFLTGGYYEDMRDGVIAQAKEVINRIKQLEV